MEQVIARSTASQNFNLLVLTIFGCAALLLAAMSAGAANVRRMVVFYGLRLALIGVIVGLAAAFALTRVIQSLLFGVKPWDP
jgi:putative ABC transport system permease protein